MIHERKQLDRRRFLQGLGATAACGLATSTAVAFDDDGLIDTHVYVGNWPLRRLSANAPAELVAVLRRAGVTQAWAGSFEGLFHKDVHGANLRLVKACRNAGDGMMIPIGSVNPTLPDWEEDLRRCHESFKMPGIRLHPNYHGYALDEPRFARLLELAAARGLFVQIVADLAAKRQRYLTPAVSRVDLGPLARIVARIRDLRLLIAGAKLPETPQLNESAKGSSTFFDFEQDTDDQALRRLRNRVSDDRIVYGSTAPLSDVAASTNLLRHAKLTAEQSHAVFSGNARRLIR